MRIIKYIYHNQDFSIIKHELNEDNICAHFSQAFTMNCTKLIVELEKMIVNEYLNPVNAPHFYLDAIVFDNKHIIEACETIIQSHIDRILDDEQEAEFLYRLPAERMVSLFKANGLNCKDEYHLMEFFEKYLKVRDKLPRTKEEIKKDWDELYKKVSPEE